MLVEGMSAETVGTCCQGKELQSLAFNESPQQRSGPNTAIRGTFHWKLTQVKLKKISIWYFTGALRTRVTKPLTVLRNSKA